jgi:hypothetical protein
MMIVVEPTVTGLFMVSVTNDIGAAGTPLAAVETFAEATEAAMLIAKHTHAPAIQFFSAIRCCNG